MVEGEGIPEDDSSARFEDLTVDDDLPIIERVVRYVKSSIALQRLVHVKMLAETSTLAGYVVVCAQTITLWLCFLLWGRRECIKKCCHYANGHLILVLLSFFSSSSSLPIHSVSLSLSFCLHIYDTQNPLTHHQSNCYATSDCPVHQYVIARPGKCHPATHCGPIVTRFDCLYAPTRTRPEGQLLYRSTQFAQTVC
jgi:hypothetical protein